MAILRTANQPIAQNLLRRTQYLLQEARRATIGGLLGGTFLPNTRYIMNNNFTMPLIASMTTPEFLGPMLTAPVKATIVSPFKSIGEALPAKWSVAIRTELDRLAGKLSFGSFVDERGITWTRQAMRDAFARNNIRTTQVGFEFSDTLLKDVSRTARMDRSFNTSSWGKTALRYLDPSKKNIWNIWGEQADMALREATFSVAIKSGYTEEQATRLAREALFDYGKIPSWERKYLARYILFYSFMRQQTAEVAMSVLKPASRTALASQMRASIALQKQAEAWYLGPDYVKQRLWAKHGKEFETYETVLGGLQVPSFAAFDMITNALYYAYPENWGSVSPSKALEGVTTTILATPAFDAARSISSLRGTEYAPNGYVPTQILASIQGADSVMPGTFEAFKKFFHIEYVPLDRRTPGEATFNDGEQYQFADREGRTKYIAFILALYTSSIYRNLIDWSQMVIKANGLEGAELKRGEDGEWYLYATALQTAMKVPDELNQKNKVNREVMKELRDIAKEK